MSRPGQWQKGQSGNPKGREKKGTALTEILRNTLDKKGPDGMLVKQRMVNMLIQLADNGDIRALQYIIDRLDGRPEIKATVQTVEPIEVRVTHATEGL